MQGIPWQPDPNAIGMEVMSRVIVPIVKGPDEREHADHIPPSGRGIAVEKSEYLAMGPTPGCYGCKAMARGDTDRKPRNAECRARVIEWLKRQEGHDVQARLAAAQMRQQASAQEGREEVRRMRREVRKQEL